MRISNNSPAQMRITLQKNNTGVKLDKPKIDNCTEVKFDTLDEKIPATKVKAVREKSSEFAVSMKLDTSDLSPEELAKLKESVDKANNITLYSRNGDKYKFNLQKGPTFTGIINEKV